MAGQHGQGHDQAAAVEAHRRPLGLGLAHGGDQGLELDQPACAGPASPAARPRPAPRSAGRRAAAGRGSSTRLSPWSPISNSPSSPVGPNRCLTASRSRRAWCRSPSKLSTVSTMCSSVRGPASDPSLVTWPTSTMATCRDLARPTSWSAHSRTWVTLPGTPVARRSPSVGGPDRHGLDGVDHHQIGLGLDHGGDHRADVGGRTGSAARAGPGPSRSARSRTWWADSSAETSSTRWPGRGPGRQHLEQQGGLADARLAARGG